VTSKVKDETSFLGSIMPQEGEISLNGLLLLLLLMLLKLQ